MEKTLIMQLSQFHHLNIFLYYLSLVFYFHFISLHKRSFMRIIKLILNLIKIKLYRKILNGIGIRKVVISGGGSLGKHLDDFFEAIGLKVLNGWGLTETSPVLACRRTNEKYNVRGSVGIPMSETEIKVVDAETNEEVKDGIKGLVMARGPGVMSGYYKNKKDTDKVFRLGDGWFDTGNF